ncbi:hypothetical protein BKA70DRAFT_1471143 [Coprinopsis sp. MPI-PUGE-AT-0042]|nr:hypothetical protein BKA70DRAFT_1471143 [Coprinopsis sp. MPI-PUGE-AT-0042]
MAMQFPQQLALSRSRSSNTSTMKSIIFSTFVTFALVLQASAYLDHEDGAFQANNMKRFRPIKRGQNGNVDIRTFGRTDHIFGLGKRAIKCTPTPCPKPTSAGFYKCVPYTCSRAKK